MDLIYTHKSGGQLWQGNRSDVQGLFRRPNSKVALIGLFALEFQLPRANSPYELLNAGYDDNDAADDDELKKIVNIADSASNRFASALREGKGCVSSCYLGLNRSGLVSALTLMKVAGLKPDEAIKLVRRSRVPQQGMSALCNEKFVELIRHMGPMSGTKSTWTEWCSNLDRAARFC